MKAAYYAGGLKVTIGECKIQAPGPGEVRIEVAYCGVCGTDLHIYMGPCGRPHRYAKGDRARDGGQNR